MELWARPPVLLPALSQASHSPLLHAHPSVLSPARSKITNKNLLIDCGDDLFSDDVLLNSAALLFGCFFWNPLQATSSSCLFEAEKPTMHTPCNEQHCEGSHAIKPHNNLGTTVLRDDHKAHLACSCHRRRPATWWCRPSCRPPHRQGHPAGGLMTGHGTKIGTQQHNEEWVHCSSWQHTAGESRPAMGCWYTSLLPILKEQRRLMCLDSCHKVRLGRAAPTTARRRWDRARERRTPRSQAIPS